MKLLLKRKNNHLVIADHVEIASTIVQRVIGLLGKSEFTEGKALWIQRCTSIHTFFMRFPIDVVFVDKELKVCKVVQNIKPFRLANSYFCGHSVFEFSSPHPVLKELQPGDTLYVGN
ncbi:MAG: hypothetical protein A4S09_11730 [Proteobacteria bacterium SG_bin7]|nr:MAG: hypothetical protein A4S09_11730 [Proteobacteria bacterium SG_bin7]